MKAIPSGKPLGSWILSILGFVILVMVVSKPLLLALAVIPIITAARFLGTTKEVNRSLKYSGLLAVMVLGFNVLFVSQGALAIFSYTISLSVGDYLLDITLRITLESVVFGAVMAVRLVLVICYFSAVINAVLPEDIFSTGKGKLPLTVVLGIRLLPIIQRDARDSLEAQKARGIVGQGRRELLRKAKYILFPLMARAVERGSDLSSVLSIRGYGLRHRIEKERISVQVFPPIIAAVAGGTMAFLGMGSMTIYPSFTYEIVRGGELLIYLASLLLLLVPIISWRGE